MKKITLIIVCMALIWSCKQEQKTVEKKTVVEKQIKTYPETVSKIFDAHGGIDAWNTLKGMYFEIEKPSGNDIYNVSLKDRKSLITMPHHKIGYDGENVWLQNMDTTQYKGNARFYYNLMFYFYAMPYVLGDDGINYSEAPSITVNNKEYPGILISYNDGVGESSEDEYILYYDKDTYRMSWLGYTVTFFSKEKSKKFNLIKYDQWETLEGVELPTVIQWHQFAEGVVGDKRNDVKFVNAKLSRQSLDETMFRVPDSTMIIQ